jgi:prepilin-type N-terminal cleavage/methylation domain-containing protein
MSIPILIRWGRLGRVSPTRAFTLVELLVAMAIIGTLVAMLMPAVQSAREVARRTQCTNNLRQIGIAVMSFEGTNKHLPRGDWRQRTSSTGVDSLATWVSLTLPYIEEADLYRRPPCAATSSKQSDSSHGRTNSPGNGEQANCDSAAFLGLPMRSSAACAIRRLSRVVAETQLTGDNL